MIPIALCKVYADNRISKCTRPISLGSPVLNLQNTVVDIITSALFSYAVLIFIYVRNKRQFFYKLRKSLRSHI